MTKLAALLLAILTVLLTNSTSAQPSGTDKAAAEALFQQGKTLMQQKDYAGACAKFGASNKLDPAVGTLLFLGECNEKLGKTATAWASFQEASSLAANSGDGKRQQVATVRATALKPQVSNLIVAVAGSDTEGLAIRRNGIDLPKATWGTPLPVDAGEHEIGASAPGKMTWAKTVTVSDGGETITIDIPQLAAVATTAAAPVAPEPTPPPDTRDEASNGTPMLIAGIVVGGVGLVGLGVGTVFGIMAKGSNSDSLDLCRTDTLCSDEGLALREDAQTQATVSTAAFIAGGVLVAGGLTLILLAPSDDGEAGGGDQVALSTAFGPDRAGLMLGGVW